LIGGLKLGGMVFDRLEDAISGSKEMMLELRGFYYKLAVTSAVRILNLRTKLKLNPVEFQT